MRRRPRINNEESQTRPERLEDREQLERRLELNRTKGKAEHTISRSTYTRAIRKARERRKQYGEEHNKYTTRQTQKKTSED